MSFSLRGPLLGLAAFGSLALAAPAWAGCGADTAVKPASWDGASAHALFQQINLGTPSIVGMWDIRMTSGGNAVDFGYQQWHSDGTEIFNSGGRSPASENFCLGVWEQTGAFSYKLNHWALSYDPATGVMNAKVDIKENVTVAQNGTRFSGTFTLQPYDPNTNAPLGPPLVGQVTGRRVTVD